MNRSLLLLLFDFLLVSMLSLAHFSALEETPQPDKPQVRAQAPTQDPELVEALRVSLEAEKGSRQELSAALAQARKELQVAETDLARRESEAKRLAEDQKSAEALAARLGEERARLEKERRELSSQFDRTRAQLDAAERERTALRENLGELQKQSGVSQERMRFLQEELQRREATLAQTSKQLGELEQSKRMLELERQALTTKLEVAEVEKRIVSQNLENTRTQLQTAAQQAARLAEGVNTLAESTGAIREEVKQLRPLSMNTIFDTYRSNRVTLKLSAVRPGLFGDARRDYEVRTILLKGVDGQTYALLHAEDTPFDPAAQGKVRKLTATLVGRGGEVALTRAVWPTSDPRVLLLPVPEAAVPQAGVQPFSPAKDPLRFPEAVLVNSGENYYGESTFRLDPELPQYLRMQTRILTRLFGEFSPKSADIVFAKTGELLGVMANGEYAALLLAPPATGSTSVGLGEAYDADLGDAVLARQRARLLQIPRDLY